jgi:hypothetical protein
MNTLCIEDRRCETEVGDGILKMADYRKETGGRRREKGGVERRRKEKEYDRRGK